MDSSVDFKDQPTIGCLRDLISALRGDKGCPWDRKQTPSSLAIYLIEEMYELVEAIEADDTEAIREELGDVLFQLFFLVALYQEAGRFSLEAVLKQIIEKMVRRHPHVFGKARVGSADAVKAQWRRIKAQEKSSPDQSILDSVPSGTPALMRAFRISERAAGIGFDWPDLGGVIQQVEAEWQEFKDELDMPEPQEPKRSNQVMEFGDLLFSMINVARLAKIHPETALSRATQKFIRRFRQMEMLARESERSLEGVPRHEMEALWEKTKRTE